MGIKGGERAGGKDSTVGERSQRKAESGMLHPPAVTCLTDPAVPWEDLGTELPLLELQHTRL